MNRPSAAELARARALLSFECAEGGAGDWPTAAGHLFDKVFLHLAPLIGTAGVKALFARSVRITKTEFGSFDVTSVETSASLRVCLQTQSEDVALVMATALFGAFFTLVTSYIGARLTTQVLRNAWPTSEDAGGQERSK